MRTCKGCHREQPSGPRRTGDTVTFDVFVASLTELRDAALQRAKDAETLALFGLACLDVARRASEGAQGG